MSGHTSPVIVVLGRRAVPVALRVRSALPGACLAGPAAIDGAVELDLAFERARDVLENAFRAGRPIIAIAAAGIVIRILAPLLQDKRHEPPVVAVAEDGSAVVPLLGGHRGANRLARRIGAVLEVRPAITTASETRLGAALDDPPPGWRTHPASAVKSVGAALLEGLPVALEVRAGGPPAWLGALPAGGSPRAMIRVTDRAGEPLPDEVVLHPAVLAVGIGCERGVAADEVLALVARTLTDAGLAPGALACFATLDLKEDEPALEALERRYEVPLRLFDALSLETLTPRLATPSEEVFRAVGCHGVAEAAALAAAGPNAVLVAAKRKSPRATCAIARAARPIDPTGAGRGRGHLAVVGLGPGATAWRTEEAGRLIRRAGHLVGYRGYLDLVPPEAGQQRHGFELGEETERCRHALRLAAAGDRVALVCSGDPGIFAMAALVVELIESPDEPAWQRLELTVSPGVSALQAAAAAAGAPLGNDFCAISLSDLLAPWPVIERRLEAAADGDFVTVLFNPASRRRRRGLDRALEILARHRPPATPVVLARNVGRAGQSVNIAPLGHFDPDAVDMLSLVIVGASSTRVVGRPSRPRLVVTPRGYPSRDGPAT